MSSNIQENDVVALGSGKTAWWGSQEGKLFAGKLSPLRCYAEGVAQFEVSEHPVIVDGMEIEGKKGLIANWQNGKRNPLSVVGEDYGVFQNSSFFEVLEKTYNAAPCVETAGTLGNGRQVWALVSAGVQTIQSGDDVKDFDLWVNSFDGSYSFACIGTSVRVVCNNTLTLAVGRARSRVLNLKHTRNITALAENAIATLSTSRALRAVEYDKMRVLAQREMSSQQAHGFFRALLGIESGDEIATRTQTTLEKLTDLFSNGTGNRGRTQWDALNAVTEFTDYFRTLRVGNGNAQEARFSSSLLGSGANFKQKAFDMLIPA